MQTSELSELLSDQPIFSDLAPEHLALLAPLARQVSLHAGEYAFDEGKTATDLMILSSGTIALEQFGGDIGSIEIETLKPGAVLSFAWLIPPHIHWLSARAKNRVEILVLDGTKLRDKCLENPQFGYELICSMTKVAANRLTKTRRKLLQEIGG